MSKAKIFFYSCLCFIAGVAAASLVMDLKALEFYFFVLSILFLLTACLGSLKKHQRGIFLMLAFFCLGFWRLLISVPIDSPDKIWFYNESNINLQATIISEVEQRTDSQKFEVETDKYQGKVLVTANLHPRYYYGDILELNCNLKTPEKIEDFSYDKYLARYNIYSLCYYPAISIVSSDTAISTKIYAKIFVFKSSLREVINKNIPEPEAGLANAMVLGYKRGIDPDIRDKFSQAGISHIAAISGLHISILVVIVFNFLLYLSVKRKLAFYFTSLALFLYIVMIGLPASAVRAGLMGFLVLLAMHLGRLNKLKYSLMIAAFVLLLINPKLLLFDVGFQLSFLAVLGIASLFPWLKKYSGKTGSIWDIIWVSISAQLFTMPVVVYNFKVLSIISPVANLLVLWTLPVIIISIFSALLLNLVLPGMAAALFFPAWLFLKYIISIADFLTKLPLSSVLF